MTNNAVQAILRYFQVKKGDLLISGRTCSDLLAEHGSPLYVYDLTVISAKLEKLHRALPDRIHIHYAIKANPHPEIIRFFNSRKTGVDVASKGELKLALEAGIDPGEIGFAGPGKTDAEISFACEKEIGSLNAESVNELARANAIARGMNKKLCVSLRINPAYELIGSGMKMGGGPKQFGIDQEEIPSVLRQFSNWNNLKFTGFHIFSGSQNLRAESISDSFDKALYTVEDLLPHCPSVPAKVNLGGGFGIPYYEKDQELDIDAVGRKLSDRIAGVDQRLKNTQFIVESGRYLVGESGVYLTKVVDKKTSRGEVFLVVDGGMHHHLAASGNFGQVIKRNYPIIAPDSLGSNNMQTVNIVGPLCTPLDRIGSRVNLPDMNTGDIVGILASGAYGFTASPLAFLGHPSPMQVALP